MVKDDSKKNLGFIALFKLFLFDVKIEILLNSWHFFMAFCIHSPPPPTLTATLIFLLMKAVDVVHLWTKFHLQGTCICGALIFEMFV